jgi:ABC-type uncharacterized transport system permease subunit
MRLMNSVNKYFFVLKLVWMERLAYRVNFFMEVLSGILSSLIVVFLWMAIYRSAGKEVIASMLLANFQIKDISITDPPIEKVIGSLYLKPDTPDQD